MSLTPGEDDCNEEVDIDEQEKDIADQVLDNILKMSGIERSVQVFNIEVLVMLKNELIFRPRIYSNWMERKLLYAFQKRALQSFTKEVYPAYTSKIGILIYSIEYMLKLTKLSKLSGP